MTDTRLSDAAPPRSVWASVGIRFFSWIAAIALALAAVFLFKYAGGPPWLVPAARAALGVAAGVGLLIVSELGWAAKYRVTANATDAASIAILYSTFFAMNARWGVALWIALLGMLLVTVAAVALAIRRDSIFIAFLGLIGGFATAALLASGKNYPVAVFAYLLLLNGGIFWLAYRRRWPTLAALCVILTAFFEWAWVVLFLNVGSLALAAGIVLILAIVETSPLWYPAPEDCPAAFRRIGAAAGVLPLLFAVYVAAHANYGPRIFILFGFLLLIDAALLAIVSRGGPRWLHAAGGIVTLITMLAWLRLSYAHQSWPWSLLWLALFIALYLIRITPFAPLLFFVFIGLAVHEPRGYALLLGAMLVLLADVLVVTIRGGRAILGAIAVAFSSAALMTLHPPLGPLLLFHAILFAALFVVAWITEQHVLAILAIPFYAVAVITAQWSPDFAQYAAWPQLAVAVVPYALLIAYPLALGARVKMSVAPYVAAALASLVFFFSAAAAIDGRLVGLVPLAAAMMMFVLLWRAARIEPREPRVTLTGAAALAFLNIAIAMLLPKELAVVLWAIEAAVLVRLFVRFRHAGLIVWSAGLAAAVFFQLAFDADLHRYHFVYSIGNALVVCGVYGACAVAMFIAAYLIRRDVPALQRALSVAGLFELWFLLNIGIANWYHSANGALSFDFTFSSPAENVTYTIAWAGIATALLVLGFVIRWPAARGAALALLIAAIVKCFFNDLARLGGVYLVVSLAGLAVSLVIVGLTLQKFEAIPPRLRS